MKKIVMIIICIISAFSLYISVISMHRLHTVSEKLSNDIVNSIISICRGLDIDYIQAEIQGAAFSDRSIFHQTEMFLQEISTQLDTYSLIHPKDNLEVNNIISDCKVLLQKIKYSEDPAQAIRLLKELNEYLYLYYDEAIFYDKIKLNRKYLREKDGFLKERIEEDYPKYYQLHLNIVSQN